MTLSTIMPTWKGWLALAAGTAVAVIVPRLIPAYDGPRVSTVQYAVAVLLAVVTIVACLPCFQKGRAADRVAAAVTIMVASWVYHVFIHRVV